MIRFIPKALPRVSKRINCVYRYNGYIPIEDLLPGDLVWNKATHELLERVFKDDKPRCKALGKLLTMGAVGVIIYNSRSWAGHCFIGPPNVPLPSHLPKSLARNFWWMFYMHTKDEFRGQGLQKIYIKLSLLLIRSLGGKLENVYSDTSIYNPASRKAHEHTGFEQAGIIRQLELKLPKIGLVILRHEWTSESHPKIEEIR